jgi:hypothetical protein
MRDHDTTGAQYRTFPNSKVLKKPSLCSILRNAAHVAAAKDRSAAAGGKVLTVG